MKCVCKGFVRTVSADERVQIITWLISPRSIRHHGCTIFIFIKVVRLTLSPVRSSDISTCWEPECRFEEANPHLCTAGQQIPDFSICCIIGDCDQRWAFLPTVRIRIIPTHFGLNGKIGSCRDEDGDNVVSEVLWYNRQSCRWAYKVSYLLGSHRARSLNPAIFKLSSTPTS